MNKIILNLKGLYNIAKKSNSNFELDGDILKQKIIPKWMEKQIEKDLQPFVREKIDSEKMQQTIQNLKKIKKNKPQIIHIKIYKNNISLKKIMPVKFHPRFIRFINFLNSCLKVINFPDVEFLYSIDDLYEDANWLKNIHVPIFVISKTKENKQVVLFPHIEWFSQNSLLLHKITQNNKRYEWENKKSQAYWTGSSSGNQKTMEDNLRYKVIKQAKDYRNILKADFSSLCQWDIKMKKRFLQKFSLIQGLLPFEQIQYKYLLALDGNAFPGSFFWQLFSNSVILKNRSDYLEWYYSALEPNKHFMEFSCEDNDLIKKINFLRNNDKKAREMAHHSIDFAQNNLSNDMIVVYIYKLLEAYANIN